MIVVDASAALSALLNAGTARQTLRDEQLHIPHLADSEIAHGLRRRVLACDVKAAAAWSALDTWRHLGTTRHPVFALLGRVWELRADVSAYDAAYIALAESLDCTLVTADGRLAGAAGTRCAVTVVPV